MILRSSPLKLNEMELRDGKSIDTTPARKHSTYDSYRRRSTRRTSLQLDTVHENDATLPQPPPQSPMSTLSTMSVQSSSAGGDQWNLNSFAIQPSTPVSMFPASLVRSLPSPSTRTSVMRSQNALNAADNNNNNAFNIQQQRRVTRSLSKSSQSSTSVLSQSNSSSQESSSSNRSNRVVQSANNDEDISSSAKISVGSLAYTVSDYVLKLIMYLMKQCWATLSYYPILRQSFLSLIMILYLYRQLMLSPDITIDAAVQTPVVDLIIPQISKLQSQLQDVYSFIEDSTNKLKQDLYDQWYVQENRLNLSLSQVIERLNLVEVQMRQQEESQQLLQQELKGGSLTQPDSNNNDVNYASRFAGAKVIRYAGMTSKVYVRDQHSKPRDQLQKDFKLSQIWNWISQSGSKYFTLSPFRLLQISGVSSSVKNFPPEVVLENANDLQMGKCWCFKRDQGFLTFKLAKSTTIQRIEYRHQRGLTDQWMADAPKEIEIWAMSQPSSAGSLSYQESSHLEYLYQGFSSTYGNQSSYSVNDDIDSNVSTAQAEFLGLLTFNASSSQSSSIQVSNASPFEALQLRIRSNHGNPEFTCLYQIGVY
ncbi:hypothetical protein MP228_001587 [Amoeboaphelidium protococcarum]|nr:hypothetical protein MP228_001587 [Amoeboaphelidium protococcarum]